MMGLLIEEEQNQKILYGIIKFSNDKILVGDMHQIPLELPSEWVKEIVSVANSKGYYGEGIGVSTSNFLAASRSIRPNCPPPSIPTLIIQQR